MRGTLVAVVAGVALTVAAARPAVADEHIPDGSTFVLDHEGPSAVPVGAGVNVVLTASDGQSSGLAGLRVRFVRSGPGTEQAESCPASSLDLCAETDVDGIARYEFVGGQIGAAEVVAEVYEADGTAIAVAGPDIVQFMGHGDPIVMHLSGRSRDGKDVLKVNGPGVAEGARVKLQKSVAGEWKQLGPAERLNSLGNWTFKVQDPNGNRLTKYRAKVSPTVDTMGDTTNTVRLK